MNDLDRYIKHFIKICIGRKDPSWPMFQFERSINPRTWKQHDAILQAAETVLAEQEKYESEEAYAKSSDPIVLQGFKLKKMIEREFRNKSKTDSEYRNLRILIHIPDENKSPAGYSLFTNFLEAFLFVGIEAKAFGWHDNTQKVFEEFKPTAFLSSDHEIFLSRLDWNAIADYRKNNNLKIGLTASLQEYGNTPLGERLAWAKTKNINFYYTFRDLDYVHTRKEYQPFFDAGYSILPLMFGANVEVYYPVPSISRDLNYVFLASQNPSKAPRYDTYMKSIFKKYPGFIDGPGWKHVSHFNFNRDRDRYIYARAKAGVNIHLPEQIDWACEVNERTFMLAACGVPQIVDDAKLLPKLFSQNALFIAKKPEDYSKHVEEILHDPEKAQSVALKAQQEVFEKHTTFHRASLFIEALQKIKN